MKKGLMAISTAIASILPANGQSPPPKGPVDECTELWKEYDLDDDGILSDTEAARLKAILAVIDTNKDGTISKDEFLVACRKGVLKDVKK